jgi:adenylylsulfate kinase-like enzyme
MQIRITGTSGEGKSSVARLITKALQEHGIQAATISDDKGEGSHVEQDLDACLSAMKDKQVGISITYGSVKKCPTEKW